MMRALLRVSPALALVSPPLGLALAQAPSSVLSLGDASIPALPPQVEGGLVAYVVDEVGQGGIDLNGDGQVAGQVLHLYDGTSGVKTNLGTACRDFHLAGGELAYSVPEQEQGPTDLNGDGDTDDALWFVRDLASGTTTSLGVVGWGSRWVDGLLFLESLESSASADLNGDGDQEDTVVYVYDPSSGTLHATGLASRSEWCAATESAAALLVLEGEQGQDLNQDGDQADLVLQTLELATGVVRNLGVAASNVRAVGSFVVFALSEIGQGADVNGDGDAYDTIFAYADPLAPGSVLDIGLAIDSDDFGAVGDRAWFCGLEGAQGGLDLNGDGDAWDEVLFTYQPTTGLLTPYKLDVLSPEVIGLDTSPRVDGSRIAFLVSENGQGLTDLNGDGDAWDDVLFVHDLAQPAPVNLGACPKWMRWHGSRLAYDEPELQNGVDLNGDGDLDDLVQQVYDAATGTIANVGIARGYAPGLDTWFVASELGQGVDWNLDGDQLDDVPIAWDPATGQTTALPLAVEDLGPLDAKGSDLAPSGWDESGIAFLTYESDGGVDLNGDLDLYDWIVCVAEPGHAHGLATDTDHVSLSAGGAQELRIDTPHPSAPRLYWVAGSASGTAPGVALGGGVVVPLNPDPYLLLTLNKPNQGPLVDTLGFVDPLGDGRASVAVPPGTTPTLVGVVLHHAFGVIDAATGTVEQVSNAAPLVLLP